MTSGGGISMVAYWEPKEGSDRCEWEDGVAYDVTSGRFAVADGASTGSRSREWAYSLVEAYIKRPPKVGGRTECVRRGFTEWADDVRTSFDPEDPKYSHARTPDWVQQQTKQRGAYATLLAGRVSGDEVAAISYGDCCLFHVHDGDVSSFPAATAADFGSAPELINSKPSTRDDEFDRLTVYRAPLGPDDMIVVASDAFAEWLIGTRGDTDVWRMIRRVGANEFGALCEQLRERSLMKNDDVTLFRLKGTLR